MMPESYEYFAFISYSHSDTKWGIWLHRKLERYRLPTTLCKQHGWKSCPFRPIFFAPAEIQPGMLSDELYKSLQASKHLIVLCSPDSAHSAWVAEEIRYFHSLGRAENIHLFIIDGDPNSGNPETECFNPVLKELGMPELLGANIHEHVYRHGWQNRERAFVQLITKMLGISFDSIWNRHKRILRQRVAAWSAGSLLVAAALASTWVLNREIDVSFCISEAKPVNPLLPPPTGATIYLEIGEETKKDTIHDCSGKAVFHNISRRLLGREVRVYASCRDFKDIDTLLCLRKDNLLVLRRDPKIFGDVHFRLWNISDSRPESGARVEISGYTAISDSVGIISLYIPLHQQDTIYTLHSEIPLVDTVLTMPLSENSIVRTKSK